MKDEIKEILNDIKDIVDGYVERCGYEQDKIIYDEINYSSRQWYLLLEYITNLQEENEKLLKKSYSDDVKITKAIEYNKKILEESWYGGYEKENAIKNINILQGEE